MDKNPNRLPSPYEDELLYSVIARYHRHSGNIRHTTTYLEIMGDEKIRSINPFYLTRCNQYFLNVWPERIKCPEDLMQAYTLDPFVMRYTSPQRKQELLSKVKTGETVGNWPAMERGENGPSLRYCPLCCKEDEARYGEMYWHREHQIQTMPICPKHLCRLEDSQIDGKKASWHLFAADKILCNVDAPNFSCTVGEKAYAQYLRFALTAPFSYTEETPVDAIQKLLEIGGYMSCNGMRQKYYGNKLYVDMRSVLGPELVDAFLSEKGAVITLTRMVGEKTFTGTEQFMLVAAYLEVPLNSLFVSEITDNTAFTNPLCAKIQEMYKTGYIWSKVLVAKQLGVHSWEVDKIADAAGVPCFWSERKVGKGYHAVPQESLKAYVTRTQKDKVMRRIQELGVDGPSAYIKYCISKDMEL